MPWGLKRYYGTGSLHFITLSLLLTQAATWQARAAAAR